MKRKDGFSGERALVLPTSIIKEMEKNPLSAQLHITDIGYYPNARFHYRERQEPITQYVLIYCVEGSGWFRLNGELYPVSRNQFFTLPAGLPHSYAANDTDPWTIYWVHFKGNLAGFYAEGFAHPTDIRPNVNSRINNRNDLFEDIFRTLSMGYSMENLLYATSVFFHFLGSLRYLQSYRNAAQPAAEEFDIVTAAIHFMIENVENRLSLSEITDHIGYSTSHFSMIFRKRTGYSPTAYFNQIKIQKACQLLDFTDMKVNQICYKIGIEDCYYFSRLFTKIMGVSPREYKKAKKG